MLKFTSENKALQYLANVTGKKIKIAEIRDRYEVLEDGDLPEIKLKGRKYYNNDEARAANNEYADKSEHSGDFVITDDKGNPIGYVKDATVLIYSIGGGYGPDEWGETTVVVENSDGEVITDQLSEADIDYFTKEI